MTQPTDQTSPAPARTDGSDAAEAVLLALSDVRLPGEAHLVLATLPVSSLAEILSQPDIVPTAALTHWRDQTEALLASLGPEATRTRLVIAQEAMADPAALAAVLGLAESNLHPMPQVALPDPLLILLARHLLSQDPAARHVEQALWARAESLSKTRPTDPMDLMQVAKTIARDAAQRRHDATVIELLTARCVSNREEVEALARQNARLGEEMNKDRASIKALTERLDARTRDLEQLRASRAYRMTAPLRWLRGKLSRAR